VTDVCAGDLVTVRLALAPGEADDVERPNLQALPIHLVYAPRFSGGDDDERGTVGGQLAPTLHPLEYRVDLVALWCPYHGQVALDGGGGRSADDQVNYFVWYERVRCAERPLDDPTLLLRDVGGPTPIPRGAYAVSVPVPYDVRFLSGVPLVLTLSPGQRFALGSLALGAFAGDTYVLPAITFHLRF
jgi:hypothetical protein